MPPASFIHSQAWQQVQEEFGRQCERINGQLFIRYPLPRRYCYYLCSRCTLSPDTLAQASSSHKYRLFLRLEPGEASDLGVLQEFARSNSYRLHARPSVQPRQTLLLDLAKTEEEILAAMKQKHRYNIKVAQKHGVTVEVFNGSLTEGLERFWRLHSDTARRQGFRTHPKRYFELILKHLGKAGMATLLFARHENRDIATLFLIKDGDTATYLHGGSGEDSKNLMAPYLLHWEAIRLSKAEGCASYDFWGTNARFDQEKNEWRPIEGHASYGTTRLKLGFGGTIVEYPGTYDLVLRPAVYRGYQLVQSLRRRKGAFA